MNTNKRIYNGNYPSISYKKIDCLNWQYVPIEI